MYPLDQVTESLIVDCFKEGSAASNFAYEQFFTTLEQTVEELAKCFLLEFGENKELSYGRCRQGKSFNDLYAVSYTHLDVYKRQTVGGSPGRSLR